VEIFKEASKHNNVFIHTDVLYGLKVPFSKRRSETLEHHFQILQNNMPDVNFFLPAYNYSCLKTGVYDVQNDPIEVGALNEYLRNKNSFNRSNCPVFSHISNTSFNDYNLDEGKTIDPFDDKSIFHFLFHNNSYLMHYGSNFYHRSTIIHYVERISDKLLYRYDKFFPIKVKKDNKNHNIILKYHVRPKGLAFEYDFPKIEEDLKKFCNLKIFNEHRTRILGIDITMLVKFWLEKLSDDPLYFIENKWKKTISDKLSDIGRKFEIEDFE